MFVELKDEDNKIKLTMKSIPKLVKDILNEFSIPFRISVAYYTDIDAYTGLELGEACIVDYENEEPNTLEFAFKLIKKYIEILQDLDSSYKVDYKKPTKKGKKDV